MNEIELALKEMKTNFADKLAAHDVAIIELSQKSERLPAAGSAKTLGDIAVKQFAENQDIFAKSRSVSLELKAASDAVTTANTRTIMTGGMGMAGIAAPLGLQNAFNTRQAIGTTALEYSRYIGVEGAAAIQVDEGDAKAAVRPNWSLITEAAETIAGYTVISRQSLNDSAELKNGVNITLARSIATKMDDMLFNGVAGGFGGFGSLSTLHQSDTFPMLPDAISEAAAVMQVAGYAPDCVALHPSTWVEILTARGVSNDQYFSGNYLGVQEMNLRGLRVVISASVPAGRALLLDSTQSEILIVQNPVLEIGYSGDQFTRNLCTALLEVRVIPVFKATGSAMYVVPEGMSV